MNLTKIVLSRIFSRKSYNQTGLPIYPDFSIAENKIGSYNNSDIVKVVSQKTRKLAEDRISTSLDNIQLHNLMVLEFVMLKVNTKLNIIDIGGACGGNYFQITKLFPDKINKWVVVETPKMVSEGRKYFADNTLIFVENIQKAFDKSEKFDLCIAQGVIQYLPNPIEYLNNIVNKKIRYLYISRQVLAQNSDIQIVTSQKSNLSDHGPGKISGYNKIINVPVTYIPKRLFIKTITKIGYELVFELDESSEERINLENIDLLVKVKCYLFKNNSL